MQSRRATPMLQKAPSLFSVVKRIEETHEAIEKFEDAVLAAEARRRLAQIKSGRAKMLSHDEFVRQVSKIR